MNTQELAREIEKANRKMVELRRAARGEERTGWSETALAELSSALEELKVAEEELVIQNAELAAANAESQFERNRYRELFMSAPFGQLVTDLKGKILEANRAAGTMFAAPSASLTGRGLALAITTGDRDRFVRWLYVLADAAHDASVCAHCGGTAGFQMQPTGEGLPISVEITAAPVADRSGRIDSIRWCLRDVSERDKARDAERLAEEATRKDEFLAVLGHELKNPLAAIKLAADILTGESGDADRKRWAAGVVQRHADQLRRLVEDLLDVSRGSHGKINLQRQAVDVRHVVAAAVESCQTILDGKRHELIVSLPERPVMLNSDPTRLTQVVANLIDNAAKYTPSGGRVEVSVKDGAGSVTIAVEDNGIGLSADMLERIFSVYQQVDETSAAGERGLGLGLALVRQLVSLHDGSVRATSAGTAKGATFTVVLPVDTAVRPASSAPPTNGEKAVVPVGHQVLVVDDNQDACELLAERLRGAGYQVELAHDGRAALAVARDAGYQIALVDLGLPDMDGFEVCRTLKAERPELHLVALTGYSDQGSRERAAEAGFDRFLVKPLDWRILVSTLADLLASREG